MIFDGECGFCRRWVERWKRATGSAVDYVASQDVSVAERFPEIEQAWFDQAVALVERDGRVYQGPESVFRSIATQGKNRWFLVLDEIGSNRIVPIAQAIGSAGRQLQGWARFVQFPTICWISASDLSLQALCGVGMALSILLMIGLAPAVVLALFEENPFQGEPPRYVRAVLYEYRFTELGSSNWWQRNRTVPTRRRWD